MDSVPFSELSNCGKYVATLSHQHHLVISELSGTKYRTYNVLKLVEKYNKFNERLNITQLTWELVLKSSISVKLGAIIENLNILLIIDINLSEPIFIQQPTIDGTYSFEWIPPLPDTDEGYKNCKQLILYTEHNLKAKVYSLDATHIQFQLLLPLSKILIRPDSNIWSIATSTMEYNQPSMIYHFENSGSVSNLIHSFRFPNYHPNSQIQCSPNNKWISSFDQSEKIFGFQLNIYLFCGVDNPPIGKSVLSLNWLNDGIVYDEDQPLLISSNEYWFNWLGDDCVITSINDDKLQFLYLDMSLLKIVKNYETSLEFTQSWNQVLINNKIAYRVQYLHPFKRIIDVICKGRLIVVQMDNGIIVYEFSDYNTLNTIVDLQLNLFKFKACINIVLDRISVKILDKNQVMVVTTDHVFIYRDKTIQVIYQEADLRILQGKVVESRVVVFTTAKSKTNQYWRLVNMEHELPKRRKFENIINTSFDITDTFAKKKRVG